MMTPTDLRKLANTIRRRDLRAVFRGGRGTYRWRDVCDRHPDGALFQDHECGTRRTRHAPQRDRLVLSKGHTALALYVVLAERGFIPREEISTFLQHKSRLNGHPNRVKVPGVETNTGPLGHGLPIGVGMAKAAQLNGESWRTFVITGDGEMQEGSNWEAIMAAAQFKLDNLTLIIDHNRLQQGARLADTNNLAPLAPKLESFWLGRGRDRRPRHGPDLRRRCRPMTITNGKPKCIVAHTNKGQGISFMSDNVAWHHKVPNEEQYRQAMAELEAFEFEEAME